MREPYAVLQSFAKVLEPSQQELGYTVGMSCGPITALLVSVTYRLGCMR